MRHNGAIAALGMFALIFGTLPAIAQSESPLAPPPLPPPLPPASTTAPVSATAPVSVTAPGSTVPTLADSLTDKAKVDYLAGRLLYDDGDAKSAQVKFQSAYDMSKDPRLLWNIAACAKQQRRYAEVETLIQRYLAEVGTLITEEDRIGAQALLSAIQPFLANATVIANETGASVFIDDEAVGQTPFAAPLRVQLGVHKVRVEKAGFTPNEQSVDVKGGVPVAINVTLTPLAHEGKLQIIAGTGERISVDGRAVGVGTWNGTLPSGSHNVEVTGDSKLPFRSSVVIVDNQTNSVRAVLEAKPKEESAIPSWVWWVGGAAVLAGGGIGGYLLLKPEDQEPTSPAGTMEPTTVWLRFR